MTQFGNQGFRWVPSDTEIRDKIEKSDEFYPAKRNIKTPVCTTWAAG
jgi:hypothetical protein